MIFSKNKEKKNYENQILSCDVSDLFGLLLNEIVEYQRELFLETVLDFRFQLEFRIPIELPLHRHRMECTEYHAKFALCQP